MKKYTGCFIIISMAFMPDDSNAGSMTWIENAPAYYDGSPLPLVLCMHGWENPGWGQEAGKTHTCP